MSDDLTPEAVRRFIDQYESGEQGCHMEADQAQSFAATLRALSERLAEVEAEVTRLKRDEEFEAWAGRCQRETAAAKAELKRLKDAIAVKGGNEHAPTQDAYEAACDTIRKHKARAEATEARLADVQADLNAERAVRVIMKAALPVALREAADEELIRELVRRNGITNGPKSRTPHEYEVLLGIGSGNHCYLTFTDKSDVDALISKEQNNE
jgi:hypothetical protein